MLTDTVAAISTGGTSSGINIIRISGSNAMDVIQNLFTNSKKLGHQKIIYGKIIEGNRIVDEVLVSYFACPNSFTGEDVIEINCHGGRSITLEILGLVLKNGARLAEPGEFSKRAFLNGKMDLSKSEAIIDVINAKTKTQARLAINQLEGGLENKITNIRNQIIELLARIEVSIDYPEYDYEELQENQVRNILINVVNEIQKEINTYNDGKYIKEGINVAIIGGPNAGKSSLLNKLAKTDKAIVTDIEGTTRDIIEETIMVGDIVLNISDTAGIRDTDDIIEKMGVEKSLKVIQDVDLIIYVIDITKGLSDKDKETLNIIKENNKPCIVCVNKIDISREKLEGIKKETESPESVIELSIYTEEGVDTLKQKIAELFNLDAIKDNDDVIIVNERHKILLEKARQSIENVLSGLTHNLELDLISIGIKDAATSLGEIIGQDVSIDIVNKIFEKFCLGK